MKNIKEYLLNESKSKFGPVFDLLSKSYDKLGKETVMQMIRNDSTWNDDYIDSYKSLNNKTDEEAKEEIYYNLPGHLIDVLLK